MLRCQEFGLIFLLQRPLGLELLLWYTGKAPRFFQRKAVEFMIWNTAGTINHFMSCPRYEFRIACWIPVARRVSHQLDP